MKLVVKPIKDGMYCFLFTPALMLLLLCAVKLGLVNANSEVNPLLEAFINWRYSADGFFLIFFLSIAVCLLATITIKTQGLPLSENYKLAKIFNFCGSFLSKLCMFWSGVFLAFIIGSNGIEFIEAVPLQKSMAVLCIILAIAVRYIALKFKHLFIRG
jgi:hypothetical protein